LQELLLTLAQTVSNGGNLLVNVGPTKEGIIPVIMQERLKQMGQWLNTNGEAVRKRNSFRKLFFYLPAIAIKIFENCSDRFYCNKQ